MSEGGIKTKPRPQEFYRAGTAPPGFEIPGSATGPVPMGPVFNLLGVFTERYRTPCAL